MARRAVPVGRPVGGSALLLPGAFIVSFCFRRWRLFRSPGFRRFIGSNGSASGVRVVLGIRPGLHPGARLRGSVSGPCFSLNPPRRWPLSGPRLYVILSIVVPPLGALWRCGPSIILSVGSCRYIINSSNANTMQQSAHAVCAHDTRIGHYK